jgi:hypothetical protein
MHDLLSAQGSHQALLTRPLRAKHRQTKELTLLAAAEARCDFPQQCLYVGT